MRVIGTSVALVSSALVLSVGVALAQTGTVTPAPAAPANATRASKSAVEEGKAECMRLWDAGTHMSKREWSTTCARIQSRLDNLKIENLDVMGTGVPKKPGVGKQGSIDRPSGTN